MQDARTGSIGVTLPSKRRSEPDLTLDEESLSDEPNCPEYEYICTNLVCPSARQLSDIHVMTMTGREVSIENTKVSNHLKESHQASLVIDPKAILAQQYPTMLPTTCLTPERVRQLALIAQGYQYRRLSIISGREEE